MKPALFKIVALFFASLLLLCAVGPSLYTCCDLDLCASICEEDCCCTDENEDANCCVDVFSFSTDNYLDYQKQNLPSFEANIQVSALPLFQFSQSAENQNTHLTPHRIAVPPPRLYLARLGTLII